MALPDIEPDGGIGSIQLLSMRAQGLIGIQGPPLLRPFLGTARLGKPSWDRLDSWIPRFRWTAGNVEIVQTILTPVGHRGCVLILEVTNRGAATRTVLGFEGKWERTVYTLFHSRTLPVTALVRPDPWTRSLSMEALAGLPVAGWAFHAVPEADLQEAERTDEAVPIRIGWDVALSGGEHKAFALYIGVGPEADGARTTAVDLRRRGWEALLAETRRWLQGRAAPEVSALANLYNLNALFNRFFSCGRTIDTDDLVWVTSRSPRYYVSAAFWSRDAFLWSLPGLLMIDPEIAREVVLYAFRTQWRNAGMHAQYINGSVIYPGFELDELAAFAVGLGTYVRGTKDVSIAHEPAVADAMAEFPQRLSGYRGECGLYETFLDPSDDPVTYPYLTYDNVVAWRALRDLAEIWQHHGRHQEVASARTMASDLEHAIWRHCVVETEGSSTSMFAWAVDGRGAFQLYDDPPGSLLLLPYYGFCSSDHPAYLTTARRVRSLSNPWFFGGRFAAPGSAHSPDPWPMAVVNDLLVDRVEALEWLRQAEMDGGLACESVDAQTGRVKTGGAFATFAGLLAAALARHRGRWHE